MAKSLRDPKRRQTHPGAILGEDVLPQLLPQLRMTQKDFADRLGVSRLTVCEVSHEKPPVMQDMAF